MKTTKKRWFHIARARMTELEISYDGLATELSNRGIPTAKSTVGAWMVGRNEPTVQTIMEIGRILGMSISELVGEDLFFVRDPLLREIVKKIDTMTHDEKLAFAKLIGVKNKTNEVKKKDS